MSDRDLDIKIAKEIMDWTSIHCTDNLTSAIDSVCGYPPIDLSQPNAYSVLHLVPFYTEYLSAAWGIVRYLERKYKALEWKSSGDKFKIKFKFSIGDEVESQTLAMAICMASLTIKKQEV